MKTLKDFTPEVQAKIPEYIKRYTAGVFDGGRYKAFKRENAEALIHWNYETAGFKNPVVLVAENPYESQIFFNYIVANKAIFTPIIYALYCIKNDISLPDLNTGPEIESSQLHSQLDSQLRSQLHSQLRSQLHSQLHSQLDSQLYSQLHSQLRSQLRSQLDSQLHSQLRSQLDSQLYSQLHSQLDSQLRSQLGNYNNDYLFTANVYSNSLLAWYSFIGNELKIDTPINVMLNSWNGLYQNSGIYSAIFSELLCVVSKYPKKVHRDTANDLHSIEGNSVEWGASTEITIFDGYYVKGFNLSKDLFEKLSNKQVTFKDFISERNEETKSAMLSFYREKFGEEYLFLFLSEHLNEVDTYVDKKDEKFLIGTTGGMNAGVYTLFKGEISDEQIAYVRCYCPSTDRMFYLGVEPKHNNAKDAIASLYRVPAKLKPYITEINRQGEVYSTNFSQIPDMSEADYQNLVSITGNEYFKLLKYEY